MENLKWFSFLFKGKIRIEEYEFFFFSNLVGTTEYGFKIVPTYSFLNKEQ